MQNFRLIGKAGFCSMCVFVIMGWEGLLSGVMYCFKVLVHECDELPGPSM